MTTTIGRVDYIVDLDGKSVPVQARKIGAQIGAAMGKSADSQFQKSLDSYAKRWSARMSKAGNLAGTSFSDAMRSKLSSQFDSITREMADVFGDKNGIDEFVKNFDDAGEGVKTLRGNLERLRHEVIAYVDSNGEIQSTNVLNAKSYDALNAQLDRYSENLNRAANVDIDRMIASGQEWSREVESERGDLDSLRTTIAELSEGRRLDNVRLDEQVRTGRVWAKELDAASKAVADNTDELDKNRDAHDRTAKSVMNHASMWKHLSANTRQWILIIGTIAAASGEIATLGSVAGSSITVLAAALADLVIVGGVAVTGFTLLAKDIGDLSGNAALAKQALSDFGDVFDSLREAIGERMFAGFNDALGSIGDTLVALQPSILLVSDALADFFGSFASSIAAGTTGFANWQALIEAAAPLFQSLGSAAIQFGTALGTIFVAAIPSVQAFGTFLAEIANEFSTWLSTDAGQAALTGFFETLNTLAGPLVALIGAAGQALADLVTPEVIAQTAEFLDDLTAFMPALSAILGVISELNIFGIFADTLRLVGEVLQPILPQLATMAEIISTTLIYALQSLAPVFTELLIALEPVMTQFVTMGAVLLTALVPALIPVIDAITQLLPLWTQSFAALEPLIPSFIQLATILGVAFAQALLALAPLIESIVTKSTMLLDIVSPLIPVFLLFIEAGVIALTTALQIVIGVISGAITIFGALLEPVSKANAAFQVGGEKFEFLSNAVDTGITMIEDWGDTVGDVISGVLGWIDDAISAFANLFGMSSKAGSTGNSGGGGGGFASGGVVAGAAYRLTGEAGPEAIVPLNRNLSDVDPSVRALSAIAQGLSYAGNAAGPGKTVTVAAGAVVIQEVSDGARTAEAAIDRLVTTL